MSYTTVAFTALEALGHLRASNVIRSYYPPAYWSGVLVDSKGGVHWACAHRHTVAEFATQCAEATLAEHPLGGS